MGTRPGTALFLLLSFLLLTACEPSREQLAADNGAIVRQYCVDCHNDLELVADLSLERVDTAEVHADAEVWEMVVRKLRGGMMPPEGERPDPATYAGLISFLEQELDASYQPVLMSPGMHRLNRAEYANAIRDLLALEVDASEFLPSDDSSNGFDNQAGTLGLSPALLEAYLSAAGKISRRAIGSVSQATQINYRIAQDATQNYHVAGLPFGTRGGLLVEHHFPVSGEYEIRILPITLGNMGNTRAFGEVDGEQLLVLLDGEQIEQIDWDSNFGQSETGDAPQYSLRIPVEAGPHQLGVTFLASNFAPSLDLNNAFDRSTIETGGLPGFTFYPHVGRVRIDGPFDPVAADATPSRELIFSCRPESLAEESACGRQIVTTLARRAYRGFADEVDIETLVDFFERGRAAAGFDAGIEMALQRILADPKFLYRFEADRPDLAPGEAYALEGLELASRLSFFIWSSIPDDELLAVAESGQLSDPVVYEQQIRRMLADPRSAALTDNFAGQWLALRSLESHSPVVDAYPDFDNNLRQAFRRETELLFASVLDEERSVIDLLDADYTFVNDRLARHYGIPGVQGSRFRRVELGADMIGRRGLLGQGSVLTVSSQPGRTSPVMRGKWIMDTVLGIPAPDPPEDIEIPPLEASTPNTGDGRDPTIREQMEAHRGNPACIGCHNLMDPFGFALEQFDATGRWRETDKGTPIDPMATMYDGYTVSGPDDLREFLLRYDQQFASNVVENLLTYALGRGVEYLDMPVVRSIVREAAEDDYRLSTMIVAVAESEPFRMSMKVADDNQ